MKEDPKTAVVVEGGPTSKGGFIVKAKYENRKVSYAWFRTEEEMVTSIEELFPHLIRSQTTKKVKYHTVFSFCF